MTWNAITFLETKSWIDEYLLKFELLACRSLLMDRLIDGKWWWGCCKQRLRNQDKIWQGYYPVFIFYNLMNWNIGDRESRTVLYESNTRFDRNERKGKWCKKIIVRRSCKIKIVLNVVKRIGSNNCSITCPLGKFTHDRRTKGKLYNVCRYVYWQSWSHDSSNSRQWRDSPRNNTDRGMCNYPLMGN